MRRRTCECGRRIYVRKQGKRNTADPHHDKCSRCYRSLLDATRRHPLPRHPFNCEALSAAAE